MKKAMIVAASLLGAAALGTAAEAAPNANANPNSGKSAAIKECVALKKADKAGFKATYGSIRECAAEIRGENGAGDAAEVRKNAAKECKEERAADPELFAATYGSDKSKGKNAFGKCVSSKVKAAKADEPESAPAA